MKPLIPQTLRRWNFLIQRTVSVCYRKSLLILAFFLVLSGFAAYQVPQLKKTVSLEDQLDEHLESFADFQTYKKLFGTSDRLGIFITPQNGNSFTSYEICRDLLSINQIVHDFPKLVDFYSAFKVRKARYENEVLDYPTVLEDPCTKPAESKYNFAGLNDSPWFGTMISANSADFAVNFSIPKLAKRGATGFFDAELVKNFIERIRADIPVKIFWAGSPAQEYFALLALDQSNFLNVAAIILIWIGLRLFFGTWKAGLFYLSSVLLTITFIYGGMAWSGHSIDPLSVSLFLIILVACLEDFIFISYDHMKRKVKTVEGSLQSFKLLSPASFFTSFTTMIGFGSLMISPVESIQRFGLWSMMGSLVEWLIIFMLWPALMKHMPFFVDWTNAEKTYFSGGFSRSISWVPPKLVVLLLMVVFIFPFFNYQNFHLSQTPTDLFPAGHPYQQSLDYLKESRQWTADAYLVFKNEATSETRHKILTLLKNDVLVARTEGFEEIERYIQQDVHDEFTLELISRELRIGGINSKFKADTGETNIHLYLTSSETNQLNRLRDKIKNACPDKECFLTGEYVAYADYSSRLIKTLFESLFLSMIMVSFVLWYLCRGFRSPHFWPIVISSFWSPAILLCLIQLFSINITMVTCIVASILVGLTGDNAIQYLFAGNEKLNEGIKARAQGSIQCALLMAGSSLFLLASPFDPPRSLGWLLAFGFVAALIGDLWILKGLLSFSKFFRSN